MITTNKFDMGISWSDKQETRCFVWNEGEQPQQVEAPPANIANFYTFETVVRQKLESEKTHGIITVSRREVSGTEYREISLYYTAFDDPQRGRVLCVGVTPESVAQKVAETKARFAATKCFTPRELYAFPPTDVDYDPQFLIGVHLQEELGGAWFLDLNAVYEAKRLEIRTIVDECPDGRRTWTLETVWFDGKPVMVVNSSGRDGDEYHERFITDKPLFEEMISFLRSFGKQDEFEGLADIDKVIPNMTEFYGATIHDYYDTEGRKPFPSGRIKGT